jgi:branched-chain amino acid transport system permease protein
MAAGAFTVGILFRETNAPFWITLPLAALVGALLGIIFGLPSLRCAGSTSRSARWRCTSW